MYLWAKNIFRGFCYCMSIYNVKPIQKMPDILIYKLTDDVYRVLSTKTGKHAGDMKVSAHKRNIFQKELWIDALILNNSYRNRGIGTRVLNFARILSERMGFKGRLGVCAARLEIISDFAPHKFYRKFGFVADKKYMNKYIDEFIEQGKALDPNVMPPLSMRYTPENKSFKQKAVNWFCNLFLKD